MTISKIVLALANEARRGERLFLRTKKISNLKLLPKGLKRGCRKAYYFFRIRKILRILTYEDTIHIKIIAESFCSLVLIRVDRQPLILIIFQKGACAPYTEDFRLSSSLRLLASRNHRHKKTCLHIKDSILTDQFYPI